MNTVIKPWTFGRSKLTSSPHFWAIVFILVVLSLLYWFYYYTKIDLDGLWRNWFWYVEIFEFKYDVHGSLFYIPLLYAAFIFRWPGILVTWLLSMAIIFPQVVDYSPDVASLVVNTIFLTVPLLVVGFITVELKWRDRERKMLAEREAERQAHMSQIFKAQEDERRRIAQELHDDTTQTLLVIANRSQDLASDEHSKISPQVKGQIEWISDAIFRVSEDMRRLSLDLRPSILDNIGLVPALRWLVYRLNQEDNINTEMLVSGAPWKLDSGKDVMIFRIVQEALNNIRKHSQATEAMVKLEFAPETVKITVQDNGKG